MNSLNDRVNDLIINGKIDDILDILEKEAPQYDNEVVMLKSNYKGLVENQISGTISDEDLRLEVNKLKKSILLLVDRIEDLEEKVSHQQSHKPSRPRKKKSNKPIIYGAVGMALLLLIYFLPFSSNGTEVNHGSVTPDTNSEQNNSEISDEIDGTFGMEVRSGSNFIPTQVYPADNEEVFQPFEFFWRFEWIIPSSNSDLAGYHLIVIGAGASEPLVDTLFAYNEFIMDDECSHIPQQFTKGWQWKIRSLFNNDEWSEWSPTWEFNVEDYDESSFCETCPHLCN